MADENVVDLYVLAASLLVDERRAGRRATQQTWEDLRSLGDHSPEERRLHHWRRVVADGTMIAAGWLLRACRPAGEWARRGLEATTQARDAVINQNTAYVVNCWYELKLAQRRGIPSNTDRQEWRFRRSIRQMEALENLGLPPQPRPTAVFGEQV